MGFNLKTDLSARSTTGALLVLTDAVTGATLLTDGKPVGLWLHGEDSEQFQRKEDELARERAKQAEKAGRKWRYTPEMQRHEAIELLVACTTGWENANWGGVEEFSPDLVRQMYRSEKWIREQAQAFVADRASFGETSKTS